MSYFETSAPEMAIKYNQSILAEMNTISRPLLEDLGINLITYRRFFHNGDLLHLSNNAEWLNHTFLHKHWTSHSTLKRIAETPENEIRTFIWNDNPDPNDNVYGALYAFNLWNGMTVYEKSKNSTEVWAFSCAHGRPNASDIYINHFYLLKRFILYFQDKAKHLLDINNREKMIPGKLDLYTTPKEKEVKLDNFIKKTEISRYFLKTDTDEIFFTRREAQCLYYLAHGQKIKEIARILSISPRTVEHYMENAKLKVKNMSKSSIRKTYFSTIHNWVF